ncbi:hypothetical protein HDU84_002214 [Entophlyctis sp. JEL0112]|nr:hypothetical protein HDU84_002214 [Entophlyctis sp. JEL0112]
MPAELVFAVLRWLSVSELGRCRCVCRLWNTLCANEDVWRRHALYYAIGPADAVDAIAACKRSYTLFKNWHSGKPSSSDSFSTKNPKIVELSTIGHLPAVSKFNKVAVGWNYCSECTVWSFGESLRDCPLPLFEINADCRIACIDVRENIVAVGLFDGRTFAYDADTGVRIGRESLIHVNCVTCVCALGGNVVVSGGADGWICAVEFTGNGNSLLFCDRKTHADMISHIDSCESIIVAQCRSGKLSVWRFQSGDGRDDGPTLVLLRVLPAGTLFSSIAVTASGRYLYGCYEDRLVRILLTGDFDGIVEREFFARTLKKLLKFPDARGGLWGHRLLVLFEREMELVGMDPESDPDAEIQSYAKMDVSCTGRSTVCLLGNGMLLVNGVGRSEIYSFT